MTLAKLAPQPWETVVTVVLTSALLAPLAAVRVQPTPPMIWAWGMSSTLMLGLTVINCSGAASIEAVWSRTVVGILADIAIASALAVLCALLMLPRLASADVSVVLLFVFLGGRVADVVVVVFWPSGRFSLAHP